MKEEKIIDEVLEDLAKAEAKFPSFRSFHEGYAILLEEVDELWAEIKNLNIYKMTDEEIVKSKAEIRKEAKHVATMAVRFLKDLFKDGVD